MSRRLAPGWLVGPPSSSGAPDRHGTRPASRRRAAHRSAVFAAGLSWNCAIRNHLEKDAARANEHAIVVAPIHPTVFPALLSAVELFREAVLRARSRVRLNGLPPSCCRAQIAFRFPLRPYDASTYPPSTSRLALSTNGSQVIFHQPHRRGSVVRASSRHTSDTARKGKSFSRVPSLGFGCLRRVRLALPAERLRYYIRKRSRFCLTVISAFTRFTRFTRFPLTCFDFFSQLVLQPRALEQDRANCVNRVNCVNPAPDQFPSPASREMPM